MAVGGLTLVRRNGHDADQQEGRGKSLGMTWIVEKNFLVDKRLTPEKEMRGKILLPGQACQAR